MKMELWNYGDINPVSHEMVAGGHRMVTGDHGIVTGDHGMVTSVVICCGAALCFYVPADSLTTDKVLMVQQGWKQCLQQFLDK